MTPIDITPADLKTVRRILREEVPDLKVRVFGSRVSWTARENSDLDLVLMTKEPLDISRMAKLKESFSESNLPFRVDVVDWADTSESFQKIIESRSMTLPTSNEMYESNHNVNPRKQNTACRWKEVSIGEIAEVVGGGTPSTKDIENFNGNVPWLRPKDLAGFHNRYISRGARNLSQKGLDSCSAKLLPKETVLLSTRAPIGYVAIAKNPIATNQGFHSLVLRDGFLPEYIYYWMIANTKVLENHACGTTFAELSGSNLKQIRLRIPSVAVQEFIAQILGTLDDKIELNRRTNETLEATARTLFKSWFVDFDPVRAKIEGRWYRGKSLPGLPAHLYDIFPNRLVASELGQIPDNWEIKTLKDLCHKPQYGYTESARNEPVGPKFLRITDINKKSWIDWRTVPYCKITEKNFDKYRLRKGDIIIARIADPGQGVMIEEDREAVFASYLIRFRPIDRVHARILQYWLRSDKYWELVMERSTGTTRANLNAKVMSGFPLVVPSAPISEAFNKYINSIRTRVVKNALESHSLKTVRDTLLPELMSGKLDIKKTKQKGLRT